MLMDSMTLDRLLTAAVLASLAIAVAFGPELRRRSRVCGTSHRRRGSAALGVEPQQS
jgi:hypothetical protein